MIRPDQIPDEASDAAMAAVADGVSDPKAVIAAALNAWKPEPEIAWITGETETGDLLLPLPEEKSDD